LSADNAADVEHFVDQAHLRGRVACNDLYGMPLCLRWEGMTEQHVRPPQNGIERGAQLVRERGQEFVLDTQRVFRHRTRPLGDGNLPAQLGFAVHALADILDDRHGADHVVLDEERRDARALRHVAGGRLDPYEMTVEAVREHAHFALKHKGEQHRDSVIAGLDAVTLEDIQRVAQDIILEDRLNLAAIGPFDDPDRFQKLLALSA